MYLKSSKYKKIKSQKLSKYIVDTVIHPIHLGSAYMYVYMCDTRGPCDVLYVDVFVHCVSQGISCTCTYTSIYC